VALKSAKSELSKIKATNSNSKEAVKRAKTSLDEGVKALSVR